MLPWLHAVQAFSIEPCIHKILRARARGAIRGFKIGRAYRLHLNGVFVPKILYNCTRNFITAGRTATYHVVQARSLVLQEHFKITRHIIPIGRRAKLIIHHMQSFRAFGNLFHERCHKLITRLTAPSIHPERRMSESGAYCLANSSPQYLVTCIY